MMYTNLIRSLIAEEMAASRPQQRQNEQNPQQQQYQQQYNQRSQREQNQPDSELDPFFHTADAFHDYDYAILDRIARRRYKAQVQNTQNAQNTQNIQNTQSSQQSQDRDTSVHAASSRIARTLNAQEKDQIWKDLSFDRERDDNKFKIISRLANHRRENNTALALCQSLTDGVEIDSNTICDILHENAAVELAIFDTILILLENMQKRRSNNIIKAFSLRRPYSSDYITDAMMTEELQTDHTIEKLANSLMEDDAGSRLVQSGALDGVHSHTQHKDTGGLFGATYGPTNTGPATGSKARNSASSAGGGAAANSSGAGGFNPAFSRSSGKSTLTTGDAGSGHGATGHGASGHGGSGHGGSGHGGSGNDGNNVGGGNTTGVSSSKN
ncbi:hypothetical protein HK100_004475 [Physocladia obscura]|uniref:Uncharacterized protein n=1 Tax=Physocladia obscura TaxID=109957 RepID=A0AAD5XFR6_9FUNG|nr:hypothetical protein HK100_004475 [Physocladia obscura]